jgi:hypothetical protein
MQLLRRFSSVNVVGLKEIFGALEIKPKASKSVIEPFGRRCQPSPVEFLPHLSTEMGSPSTTKSGIAALEWTNFLR